MQSSPILPVDLPSFDLTPKIDPAPPVQRVHDMVCTAGLLSAWGSEGITIAGG
jgi:hypothetical protein